MFKPGIDPVISLIGAGGKTSILYYFGDCSSRMGEKVVLTTTTKVFPVEREGVPLLLEEDREKRAQKAGELLKTHSLIQVGAEITGEKVIGIDRETVQDFLQNGADRVIVEADGARGLPLKFPAEHEPALPFPPGRVFLVIGAWALGQPFSEKIFHRPELARRYLNWKEGQLIEGEHIADLLLHPKSYLPRLEGKKISVILNGVRGMWQENEAKRIGVILFRKSRVGNIYLANLKDQPILWKLLTRRQE